ncbi:MAG: hypothetical protein MUE57_08295 [Syntrophales bacterium]|jgi:hypothetical protein|nr:hypothetical protein [Syntrophales bacterium]MCU0553484.1 hypothetical protein [Syntrophales bacterium]MCU0583822.1 hypothetical protein [Syntrophales bacterium]
MKTQAKIFIALLIVLLLAGSAVALTADEVVKLKKAGVSDETIRLMIEQERAGKQSDPSDRIGVREVKDADGNASVVYSTGAPAAAAQGDSEQEKVDKAWKMLQNQNVIIDDRRR